ncbi:MAG TPA: hypothetical protein DF712_08735 [Balneola sp.]|nr:hypothetical protein [Balneola sp.]
MIFDSVLATGHTTISGCNSVDLNTDKFDSGNIKVTASNGSFHFKRKTVAGQTNMMLFMNGQTLLQEVPLTGQAVNFISFRNDTGDFFIKGSEADILDKSKIFFAEDTPLTVEYNFEYDVITGGNFAATGDLGESLKNSIQGGIGTSVFTDCDYFLNGQKVYSGIGVGVSAGTDGSSFVPIFGTTTNAGGVVTTENKNKFKYTAYKKAANSVSLTGLSPDVFSNTGFIEGRTAFYINGLRQPQNSYLELYTGVNMVKKSRSALISGGIPLGAQVSSVNL